jgi:UDP-N-acetylmuramate dehydrogenase
MSVALKRHDSAYDRLRALLGPSGEVRAHEPLAPRTSVRVGGTADLFVRPSAPDAIVATLRFAQDEGLPVHVLGGGANTLVSDDGFEGVVLKLPSDLFEEELQLSASEGLVTLGAGASISRLIHHMKSNGLVGAEFLAGIPGTLGGALSMNAGTKMGECLTVVDEVELCTPEGTGFVDRAALRYEYRHTHLPAGAVVSRVRFRLPRGDLAESQKKMDADLSYRKRTQPLSQPNFGSVFRNPPGHHAGALIERVALKGHTIGRAQISSLHANWIVNLGGATAKDVVALMELAMRRVRESEGVELIPEVKRVGSFEP